MTNLSRYSLNDAELGYTATLTKLISCQAVKGGYAGMKTFADFDDVRIITEGSIAKQFIDRNLAGATAALQNLSADLATAHRMAATVIVNAPNDQQMEEFVVKLNKVHGDVRQDQKWKVAADMAGSLANLIESKKQSI